MELEKLIELEESHHGLFYRLIGDFEPLCTCVPHAFQKCAVGSSARRL